MNGTDISMTSLYDDLAVLANSSSYTSNLQQNGTQVYGSDGKTYTTQFVSGWLSVLIQNTLVEQQLQSLGGEVTADETSQAQQSYSQLRATGEVPDDFIDGLVTANANQLALQRVIEASAPPPPSPTRTYRRTTTRTSTRSCSRLGATWRASRSWPRRSVPARRPRRRPTPRPPMLRSTRSSLGCRRVKT